MHSAFYFDRDGITGQKRHNLIAVYEDYFAIINYINLCKRQAIMM